MYRDPSTGELREPTAFEELTEAYTKQQLMSEEAARQTAARIARQQAEVDRRIAKGETVAWTDYAGPLFSGILSTRESAGAGTTETPLGATLRGTLGTLSALAAEGYFRGLGYEVNAKGEPVDPEDFGYAIADRWSLGIHYDRVGSARHDGLLARARATTYLFEGAYRPSIGQRAFLEIHLGLGAHVTALFPTTERLPYTATGSAVGLGIRYAHLLSGTVGLYLAADHAASSNDGLTLNGGRVNADGSTSFVQWNTQRITAGLMVRF